MLLRTIVEQASFDAAAAAASVKVQPEAAVTNSDTTGRLEALPGSLIALGAGAELTSPLELGDAGGEPAESLEELAAAAREYKALLCCSDADSRLEPGG
jgi:hypothetical protein